MAIQIDPPKNTSKLSIDQAWFRLMKALNSQLTDTGWSNILFVDGTDGSDTTAKPGSITFKYETIQAALDAASASDVIWVGPGTYTEDITWPNVDNLTLRGVGPQSTIITNATAVNTVTVAPTVDTVLSAAILGVAVANTSALDCIAIYGGNDLELGNGGRILLQDIIMTSSGAVTLDVDTAASLDINNVSSSDGNWTFAQVGRVLANNVTMADVEVDNDPAVAAPSAGFDAVIFNSAICDNLEVSNLGQFAGTDDVQIENMNAALVDTADAQGSIIFSGRITGNVAVTFDMDDQAGLTPLILDQARISGTFSFAMSGTGGNVTNCRAVGAVFYNGAADTITAGDEAAVDLRGATFEQVALESAGSTLGTIDRSDWWQIVTAASGSRGIVWGNAGGAVPFTSVPNFVAIELGAKSDGPASIDSKTAAGCNVDTTAGGSDVVVRAFLTEV